MLKNISIKSVASYDSDGIVFDLKRINYIYGSNGTGKTTISEFLRKVDNSEYSDCKLEWKYRESDCDLYVYNKNFIEENFNTSNDIKGIFTLGTESNEILENIKNKKQAREKHNEEIDKLEKNIKSKEEEEFKIKSNFKNNCWDLKLRYDDSFGRAFDRYHKSKQKFTDKFLYESSNNKSRLNDYNYLEEKVDELFNSDQKVRTILSEISFNDSIERHEIFKTRIIGKSEVDIADLINNLNLSDWVQQGHEHLEGTNNLCPFCQRTLPNGFRDKLDKYFDETYTRNIEELNLVINKYKTYINDIMIQINEIREKEVPNLERQRLDSLSELVQSIYNENIQFLEKKKVEPSTIVELNSIKNHITEINILINLANTRNKEFNEIISNIKYERNKLIEEIWKFITEENKLNYTNYVMEMDSLNKTLMGMKDSKDNKEKIKNKIEKDIKELQVQLTSIVHSINEINKILESFGFTNFKLAEADSSGFYKIIRENGQDVDETLSEGEKTFITFLYFYQLINGSNTKENIDTNRIIIIDDPISSLDSNILFIVSYLINKLKMKIREGDHYLKQLIILTHNIYFHKEVSFNKGRGSKKLSDEKFYIVRKNNNISYIVDYNENPIKNSYELLWKELRENRESSSIANTMRRILENYFKFFGGRDIDEVINEFTNEEKILCNALLSWVNDGSHHINDDLFIDTNQESTEKYFDVFKNIFRNSGHEAHFNMMMGLDESIEEEALINK